MGKIEEWKYMGLDWWENCEKIVKVGGIITANRHKTDFFFFSHQKRISSNCMCTTCFKRGFSYVRLCLVYFWKCTFLKTNIIYSFVFLFLSFLMLPFCRPIYLHQWYFMCILSISYIFRITWLLTCNLEYFLGNFETYFTSYRSWGYFSHFHSYMKNYFFYIHELFF